MHTLGQWVSFLQPYVVSIGGTTLTIWFAQRNKHTDNRTAAEKESYSRLGGDYERCDKERASLQTRLTAAEVQRDAAQETLNTISAEMQQRDGELRRRGLYPPQRAFDFIDKMLAEKTAEIARITANWPIQDLQDPKTSQANENKEK